MGYRFSKERDKKRGYASNMERIDKFCKKNNIRHSATSCSYYFMVNGIRYRVSDHTIEESNRMAYDIYGNQIRPLYHSCKDTEGVVNIIAGKNKIIDIYKCLVSGKKLCECY